MPIPEIPLPVPPIVEEVLPAPAVAPLNAAPMPGAAGPPNAPVAAGHGVGIRLEDRIALPFLSPNGLRRCRCNLPECMDCELLRVVNRQRAQEGLSHGPVRPLRPRFANMQRQLQEQDIELGRLQREQVVTLWELPAELFREEACVACSETAPNYSARCGHVCFCSTCALSQALAQDGQSVCPMCRSETGFFRYVNFVNWSFFLIGFFSNRIRAATILFVPLLLFL
jgi:hypothetical protein